MPGLPGDDRVDAAVVQGQGLGPAGQHRDAGQHAGELGTHAGRRFDGHDVEPALEEHPGELAGARAEVDDTPRPGRDQQIDDGGGVTGPHLLVELRGGTERRPLPLVAVVHQRPPSTRSVAPVTYDASSLRSQATAAAISSASPGPAHRDLRRHPGRPQRVAGVRMDPRVDEAGGDAVDPDAVPGQLAGETQGGDLHPGLRPPRSVPTRAVTRWWTRTRRW